MKPIMFTQKFTCILSFLISIVCPGECVLVESFYISNNTTPTKGQTIELTCTFIVDTGWDINLSIVQASSKVCECYTRIGCTQIIGAIRCSLVENSSEVFVTISNTTRSMEGDWNCETNNVKSLTLLVYTLPSSISFDDIFQQPQFLWENGVTITCKTDQCTYKDPVFTWYYLEADGTKQEFNWSHRVASTNLSNCADKEMIYYSILTLPTNATLAGNKELTTKFECQLSFNKITFHRTSGLTSDVTFAGAVVVTIETCQRHRNVNALCCRTINIIDEKIESEGIDCISSHEGFQVNCLNKHVLETSYYDHVLQNGPLEEGQLIHDVYGYIAYRGFTRWMYGLLGRKQRKVIPSCAVMAIRDRFPSEEYCEFKYPQ